MSVIMPAALKNKNGIVGDTKNQPVFLGNANAGITG